MFASFSAVVFFATFLILGICHRLDAKPYVGVASRLLGTTRKCYRRCLAMCFFTMVVVYVGVGIVEMRFIVSPVNIAMMYIIPSVFIGVTLIVIRRRFGVGFRFGK